MVSKQAHYSSLWGLMKRQDQDVEMLQNWFVHENVGGWRSSPLRAIPATGESNGMAGGADLILQGNTSLHTPAGATPPAGGAVPAPSV